MRSSYWYYIRGVKVLLGLVVVNLEADEEHGTFEDWVSNTFLVYGWDTYYWLELNDYFVMVYYLAGGEVQYALLSIYFIT